MARSPNLPDKTPRAPLERRPPIEAELFEDLDDVLQGKILSLLRAGNHFVPAVLAAGASREALGKWHARAHGTAPDLRYVRFFQLADQAIAECEARDVVTTAQAASIDGVKAQCQHCKGEVKVDIAQVYEQAGMLERAHRIRTAAAAIALQRLQLRFPKRWSKVVVHEIQIKEEHDTYLNVAAEVLPPEWFEALCLAYVARQRDGAAEPDSAGETRESVH